MKKIFVLTLIFFALAGCAAGHNEELIGEWLWTADAAYKYVFHYDGTGERGFPETWSEFTWETRGRRLNITRERDAQNEVAEEVWEFEIYDGILVVVNENPATQGRTYSYVAAVYGQNPYLVGEWHWELDEMFAHTFHADGTGSRGFAADGDTFTWVADDYRLIITRDNPLDDEIRGEIWSLEVSADRFRITSAQEEGSAFVHIRN